MNRLHRWSCKRSTLAAGAMLMLTATHATDGAALLRIPTRSIEPGACPILLDPAFAGRVQCGRLRVPEDRSREAGRTVVITFAVVQPAQSAAHDPILFVMGGNGSGLKLLKRQHALAELLAREDTVIFVDHRGSAPWTQPDMACPQFEEGLDAAKADANPGQVEACRRHLDQQLDVNLYGPFEAAQDLRDLRLALGVERWNVYGVSYGTTIAQRLITVDGEAISRIVLDGMSGADSNSFAKSFLLDPIIDLLDECSASSDCAAAFPHLEQALGKVTEELEHKPRRIDGKLVSNVEFLARIRTALADPIHRGRIPLAIQRSAKGDLSVWRRLPTESGGGGKDPAFTWPSSICREEFPRRDLAEFNPPSRRRLAAAIESGVRLGEDETWDWAQFCPRLGFKPSSAGELRIATSEIPALLLAGQLDLTTPRAWSEQAARALPNARMVVFPLTGHWVLLHHLSCAGGMVLSFFHDPDSPPDNRCVDALPTTRWERN